MLFSFQRIEPEGPKLNMTSRKPTAPRSRSRAQASPSRKAPASARTQKKPAPSRSGKSPRPGARARAALALPLLAVVQAALADMKALDVRVIDVRGHSDITDVMVIASGTSDRHVKSIADRVVQQSKSAGMRPFGIEGDREGEWVLVDLPDVMVHVMLPRVREFYALEQLWEHPLRSG